MNFCFFWLFRYGTKLFFDQELTPGAILIVSAKYYYINFSFHMPLGLLKYLENKTNMSRYKPHQSMNLSVYKLNQITP